MATLAAGCAGVGAGLPVLRDGVGRRRHQRARRGADRSRAADSADHDIPQYPLHQPLDGSALPSAAFVRQHPLGKHKDAQLLFTLHSQEGAA